MPKANTKARREPVESTPQDSLGFGGIPIAGTEHSAHNDPEPGQYVVNIHDDAKINPKYLLNSIKKRYHRTAVDIGIDEIDKKCIRLLESLGFAGGDVESRISTVREFVETLSTTSQFNQSSASKSPATRPSKFDWNAFETFANANQWRSRRERGFEWRADVFAYVETVYADWINLAREAGTPLTQADLGRVDAPLYNKLQKELGQRPAPEGFRVPAKKDLPLPKVTLDDATQAALREHWRVQSARHRQKLRHS